MIRPCFLVLDHEFPGSISTRKLVIETAKFNVLTAYSGREAIDICERFPAINGAVLDAGVEDLSCRDVVQALKRLQPKLPVIVIAGPYSAECSEADYMLESFDPGKLLEVLRSLKPEASAEIDKRNERLSQQQLLK